eukprot:9471285-Pyramimonas_sp.AAC.1
MLWTTSSGSGLAQKPSPAHPVWRRACAMPAMPWTTVTDSGRTRTPPPANPLMVSRICHACCALDDRHG